MFQSLNKTASVLVMATISVGLSACSPNEVKSSRIDVASIQGSASLTPTEKSEAMAEAAERLLTSNSFMYADEVAKLALQHDSTNAKAKFIAAVLAPTMELKGVLTRIEPLVKQRPYQYAKFAKNVAQFKQNTADKAVSDFLTKGQADIHTEREAQELIARYVSKIDALRKTVIELKDQDVTLTINEESFKQAALEKAQAKCQVREVAPYQYDLGECDLSSAYEVKFNRADFEAVQMAAAGVQTYLTVLNSYDLSGIYKKSASLEGKDQKTVLKELLKNKSFGTLRASHGMGLLPDAVRDSVVGVRYAVEIQDELCPSGEASEKVREGHLFESSICIKADDEFEQTLGLIETILKGGPTKVQIGNDETSVNIVGFFTKPLSDVRKLAPYKVNQCGDLTSIGDASFGGLFPNGDINTLLARNTPSCDPSAN